jgi:hypothetical protein
VQQECEFVKGRNSFVFKGEFGLNFDENTGQKYKEFVRPTAVKTSNGEREDPRNALLSYCSGNVRTARSIEKQKAPLTTLCFEEGATHQASFKTIGTRGRT